MKKFARFVLSTSKGIYDIVATYLLLFVVPFALAGFAYHIGFEFLASLLDFESADALWEQVASWSPINTVWLRIALFLPLHIVTFKALHEPVRKLWPRIEGAFDQLVQAFRWVTDQLPAVRVIGEWAFTLLVTALLVPFVVQPTLVPRMLAPMSWVERAANLLDGTATAELADSVVGLYRKIYADPVVAEGLKPDEQQVFDQIKDGNATGPVTPPMPNGKQPLMDRWDPYIEKISNDDAAKFAYVKAFMYIESGGRQYAVSPTGCAGLMQFCVPTARDQPYRDVFGTGAVYRCDCSGDKCRFPKEMQRDMESGEPAKLIKHEARFPCEMTDGRFDPNKIIKAGGLYVDSLRQQFGGNIYLMYIGYNSGPGVAQKVYVKLGRNPNATLDQIAPHLRDVLDNSKKSWARGRANGLIKHHLPKLKRAYNKYYVPPSTSLASNE